MTQTSTQQNQPAAADDTRQRLLDVAERLFAAQGFASSSVRELTAQAGCNIAAVNYHFGSKENLYREVFQRMLVELREQRLRAIGEAQQAQGEAATLEHLIRAFAHAFMAPLQDPVHGPLYMKLFLREMLSPQLPRGTFRQEVIGPVKGAFIEALRNFVPDLTEQRADLCVHSLVAQLVHLLQASLYFGSEQTGEAIFDPHRAIEHVVHFTIAGIEQTASRDDSPGLASQESRGSQDE